MKTITAPYQRTHPSLWEEQCRNECEIFDQCGGTYTAPCGCVKKGDEEFDCANCFIICRQRKAPPLGIYPEDTFEYQIESGKALEDVSILQKPPDIPFPLYIPLKTNELTRKTKRRYAGIQIDQIITNANIPNIRRFLKNKNKTNRHFKVHPGTQFIAVLNKTDNFLEALWRMEDRNRFYQALRGIGIEYITGPTFSICEETQTHPASHNIAMLLRHNHMVQEIYDHGFTPIPNIYWRNEMDIDRWITWIVSNPIHLISRDFSMISKASGSSNVPPTMERFTEVMKFIKKPLHVFFTGVGIVHARYLVQEFEELEKHTCTIVSSQPIMKGIAGGEKLNPFTLNYQKDWKLDRQEIACFNLDLFEDLMYRQQFKSNTGQLGLF